MLSKWLNDSPKKLKPVFYKRYVDSAFVLFKRPEQVKSLVDYMNNKLKNINFSFESEKDGQMPFLGVNVFCEKSTFETNVYRKKYLLELTQALFLFYIITTQIWPGLYVTASLFLLSL